MPPEVTSNGNGAHAPVDFWSRELLFRLDWKLLHQLAIAMIEKGGFRAKKMKIGPSGEGLYSVSSGRLRKPEVYLAFSKWRCERVPTDEVKHLYSRILSNEIGKGVFVTAGEFTQEIVEFAHGRQLELINGEALLKTIRRMPIRDRDKLLHQTTLGEFTCPSCPSCGAKMILRKTAAPEHSGSPEDVRFTQSARVDRDVRFGNLTIEPGAEVIFEKFAHAEHMVIRGSAAGELICQGTVDIHPGAIVSGSVAARSINLLPGGLLDGEMKILSADKIEPLHAPEGGPVWGCRRYPKCKGVMPVA
ncbi:MAG: restriction endonuclease [Verrucomicrobiota bacterium]